MKVIKQMGITHKDFFRLLPRAIGDHRFQVDGHHVRVTLATGPLTISLGEQLERKLSAHVVMPYTDVTFEYKGVPEEARLAFEHYFQLRFMRGLG